MSWVPGLESPTSACLSYVCLHSACRGLGVGSLTKDTPLVGVWGDCWGSAACGFHRWRGDYGGKKQLWFPSNYVEEMVSPAVLEPEREVRLELLAEQESHHQLPFAHTHHSQVCLRMHSQPTRVVITAVVSMVSNIYMPRLFNHVHTYKMYLSYAADIPSHACIQEAC